MEMFTTFDKKCLQLYDDRKEVKNLEYHNSNDVAM
jgi:hypothetical protein